MWSDLGAALRPRRLPAKKPSARLRLEQLEDRVVPAVDVILEWNAVMLQADVVSHSGLGAPDQGGPTRSARAFAIVSAAMFDAWNSINRDFTPYLTQAPNSNNASDVAAVAKAAHDTLVDLYPSQQAAFDAALTTTLRRVPNGARENRGVAVGRFVAQRILTLRSNDNSDDPQPYTPTGLPGNHNEDPLHPGQGFLTSKWGDVTPFAIFSRDDIPTRPVPDLTSAEYTAAFNQVKALGGDGVITPTLRTADQTEIGIYWGYDGSPGLGVPTRLYNQIVRTVAEQQENTVAENARLFALVNIAMVDAGIQAWGVKYDNNFWRPILGIRGGEDDGNPFSQGDPEWKYLGAPRTNGFPGETNFTPPFPAYTSGHATFGGAAFKTLANFYQTDNIPFTFISDEFNGVNRDQNGLPRPIRPRSWSSFSEAAAENAASRIFLGIHWRFDATEGVSAGNRIADFTFNNYLRPGNGNGGPEAIPDANFEDQIDAVLNGTIPPAPSAPPAPPAAMVEAANLIQALHDSGGFQLETNGEADRTVRRAMTRLERMMDRVENIMERIDRLQESTRPKAQATLQRLEAKLNDLVFSARDLMDEIGVLVEAR